jgi:hypothetical protein
MRAYLVGHREELGRPPERDEPAVVTTTFIEIEGAPVPFDVPRGVSVEPAGVRLKLATDLPDRYAAQ